MENKKTSKERLIDASSHLFRVRGYHSTSIADIADACNLRKASIYHHINSKQELGVTVLKQLNETFEKQIFNLAYDDSRSNKERLNAIATALENYFIQNEGGCLMGNMSLDSMNEIPEFTRIIQQFFNNWVEAIVHLLSERYGPEKAKVLALDSITWCQGAIVLARIFKNNAPVQRFRENMVALLA